MPALITIKEPKPARLASLFTHPTYDYSVEDLAWKFHLTETRVVDLLAEAGIVVGEDSAPDHEAPPAAVPAQDKPVVERQSAAPAGDEPGRVEQPAAPIEGMPVRLPEPVAPAPSQPARVQEAAAPAGGQSARVHKPATSAHTQPAPAPPWADTRPPKVPTATAAALVVAADATVEGSISVSRRIRDRLAAGQSTSRIAFELGLPLGRVVAELRGSRTLSRTVREILRRHAAGQPDHLIAEILGLDLGTVKDHLAAHAAPFRS